MRSTAAAGVAAALLLGAVAALPLRRMLERRRPAPVEPDDRWLSQERSTATSTVPLPLEWVPAGPGTLEINRTEVTIAQYRRCVDRGRCRPPARRGYCLDLRGPANHPIACISAGDAEAFCREVGGRLPALREWRAAASAGGTSRHPWGDEPPSCERAVIGLPECFGVGAAEVCSRPLGATPARACDLLGNLSEWTVEGARYLAVGGCWGTTSTTALASTDLSPTDPEYRTDSIGLRCVRGELSAP